MHENVEHNVMQININGINETYTNCKCNHDFTFDSFSNVAFKCVVRFGLSVLFLSYITVLLCYLSHKTYLPLLSCTWVHTLPLDT